MQTAVGATPPPIDVHITYGRPMDRQRIQSYISTLAEQTWDTDDPPAEVSPQLKETARVIRDKLLEEHDVTAYDPHSWTRIATWYVIHLCTLFIENRAAEAHAFLCTEKNIPVIRRDAVQFVPVLCPLTPQATEHERDRCNKVVLDYTVYVSGKVDDIYRRALVEIHMAKHTERNCVFDQHATLVELDAVFCKNLEGEAYLRARLFTLSRPTDHYNDTTGRTGLKYLKHLHDLCKWIVYANQRNKGIRIALAVGNSRCRSMPREITAICWASEDLCGFISPRKELVVDAADVWDLIVLLDKQYIER